MLSFSTWGLRLFGITGICGSILFILGDLSYNHIPGSKDSPALKLSRMPAARLINAALQAVGATIYGTDINGTILVTADLNGYTVKAAILPSASTAAPVIPVPGGLAISSVTSPVSQGSNATLTAQTSPNASCSITVRYKSGPSH